MMPNKDGFTVLKGIRQQRNIKFHSDDYSKIYGRRPDSWI
jgi:hypothetical protein